MIYGWSKKATPDSTALLGVEEEPDFKESFIPITRRSLIRQLVQEENFLTDSERNQFEKFCNSLDSGIVNKYHGLLQDLKALFDPINPDKDTLATRQVTRRDRLDCEFWLLQKLTGVMEKANFHELSKPTVSRALDEHDTSGVMVTVDPDKYDVLRFWALGREAPPVKLTRFEKFCIVALRRPAPTPQDYYKRMVVAVRLKRDDKLMLKAFKEVPVSALEQLLPDGKISMSKLDKSVLLSSGVAGATGVLAWVVTVLAHVYVPMTVVVTAIFAAIGLRAVTVYKNRRNAYMVALNRMLYFKNIANNRGLLALLVDRAEDEIFKEALLAYSFLLARGRAPSATAAGAGETDGGMSSTALPAQLGGMSASHLERQVEEWVLERTGERIEFDSDESLKLLRDFGILSRSEEDGDDGLSVLPLEGATSNLPQQLQSMADRVKEYDLVEGYDRDVTDETDEDYRQEAKKRRKFGWD